MKILITGAAGFIGARLSQILAQHGDDIVGIDNINDYYDVRLKYGRLDNLGITDNCVPYTDIPWKNVIQSKQYPNFRFIRLSIEDNPKLQELFQAEHFDSVIHLAAQAGVRYSIQNPYSYMQSNLVGFLNILEACRHGNVPKLIFASSSSVYGMNEKTPYKEEDRVDSPISLYAASKKSNELMAHCYSHLYGLTTIGLRYFSVYGPWGRPDMSPFLFANAIREGKAIKVYNNGDMIRDFTYIDDIVEGTIHVLDHHFSPNSFSQNVHYKVYNIGCGHPIKLLDFIEEIELAYGKKTKKEFYPIQPGDVYQTYADTTKLEQEIGYHPHWTLREGIKTFIEWYKSEQNPL